MGVLFTFLIIFCALIAADDLNCQNAGREQNSYTASESMENLSGLRDNPPEILGSYRHGRIEPLVQSSHQSNSDNIPIDILRNRESSSCDDIIEKQCILENAVNSAEQSCEFGIRTSANPIASARCDLSLLLPSSTLRSALLNQELTRDTITLSISLKLLFTDNDITPQTTTPFSNERVDGFDPGSSHAAAASADFINVNEAVSALIPDANPTAESSYAVANSANFIHANDAGSSSVPDASATSGTPSSTVISVNIIGANEAGSSIADAIAAVPAVLESEPHRPAACESSAKNFSKCDNFFSRTALRLKQRRQKREMEEQQQQIEREKLQEKEGLRKERVYRNSLSSKEPRLRKERVYRNSFLSKEPHFVSKLQTFGKSLNFHSQQPVRSSKPPTEKLVPKTSLAGPNRNRVNEPEQSVIHCIPGHAVKAVEPNHSNKCPSQPISDRGLSEHKAYGDMIRPGLKERHEVSPTLQPDGLVRDVIIGTVRHSRTNWHQPGPTSKRYILQRISDADDSEDKDNVNDYDESMLGRRLWYIDSDRAQIKVNADESHADSDIDAEELKQIDQILARNRLNYDLDWIH